MKRQQPSIRSLLFFLLVVFMGVRFPAVAQYNFHKFGFGVGGGITLPFADTRLPNFSLANQVVADYYYTPYVSTGLEFQFGHMRGGERKRNHFSNYFMFLNTHTRVQLGQYFIRYDRLNWFESVIRGSYAGVGVGIIQNNVDAYRDGVAYKMVSRDLLFPFNIGINFYFPDGGGIDRWELNLNMQFATGMEDKMDGDLSPGSAANDVYNYFSSGVRYRFGPLGLDKRKKRLK